MVQTDIARTMPFLKKEFEDLWNLFIVYLLETFQHGWNMNMVLRHFSGVPISMAISIILIEKNYYKYLRISFLGLVDSMNGITLV